MNYAILRQEIEDDPLELGYAAYVAAGSDNRIAELLNAPRGLRYTEVGLGDLLIWAASTGALAKLDAAKNGPNPSVASLAGAALALLNAQIEGINFARAEVRQMFDVLVAAGVFTAQEQDALLAIAQAPSTRAWDLGLDTVSDIDVAIALRG